MSNQDISRLRFLIKKKRAGLITEKEYEELILILGIIRKSDLGSGIKVAANLVLASVVNKQKPKELTA